MKFYFLQRKLYKVDQILSIRKRKSKSLKSSGNRGLDVHSKINQQEKASYGRTIYPAHPKPGNMESAYEEETEFWIPRKNMIKELIKKSSTS